MHTREGLSTPAVLELPPVLIKPKKYCFEVAVIKWLLILGMIGFDWFAAFHSFSATGDMSLLIIALGISLYFLKYGLDARSQMRRTTFLESYPFPASITKEVGRHYPHLSDKQLILVTHGLRQYFQLCNAAGKQMVTMPSRVVDIAWHEFILYTRAYEEFCKNGMGRFLHHTPAAAITQPMTTTDALKKAWLLACGWEEIKQKSPSRLPFLFAIDTVLAIPDGLKHPLDNDYATREFDAGGGIECGGGCGGGG